MPGLRPRFRTQMQWLWHDWNDDWIFEVASTAHSVWVRLGGFWLDSFDHWRIDPDAPAVVGWERMVTAAAPGRAPVAFVWVTPRSHAAGLDHVSRGQATPQGTEGWRRWLSWERNRTRVGDLLYDLRVRTGLPIAVHAEDLSARWVLGADFRPERLLLDNPIVTVQEAATCFARNLAVPGWVRRSAFPDLIPVNHWRFKASEPHWLASHLGITGRHGEWPADHRLPAPELLTDFVTRRAETRPPTGDASVRRPVPRQAPRSDGGGPRSPAPAS